MSRYESDVLNIMQCIAVLTVVASHSILTPPPSLFWQYVLKFIGSFFMAIFMLLSGYLFFHSRYSNFLDHIKKKASRLLVPYIIISSPFFLPRVLLNNFNSVKIQFSCSAFLNNLIYPWDNVITQFWFLPTLFLLFLIAPILKYSNNSIVDACWLIVGVLAHCYSLFSDIKIFNITGVLFYMVYFILGYMIAKYKAVLQRFVYYDYQTLIIIAVLNTAYLILVSNEAIKFLLSLVNSYFVMLIAIFYVNKEYKFLDFCNGYYYHIYLLSWLPLKIVVILGYKILHINSEFLYLIEFIAGVFVPLKLKAVTNLLLRK